MLGPFYPPEDRRMLLASVLHLLQAAGPEGGAAAPTGGAPTNAARPPGGLFSFDMIVPLLGFMVIFYFLMWRPQAKERKARAALLAAIKKGDRVVLTCGLVGDVAALTEHDVLIRFDDKDPRRMRFKRYAIHTVVKDDAGAPSEVAESEAK